MKRILFVSIVVCFVLAVASPDAQWSNKPDPTVNTSRIVQNFVVQTAPDSNNVTRSVGGTIAMSVVHFTNTVTPPKDSARGDNLANVAPNENALGADGHIEFQNKTSPAANAKVVTNHGGAKSHAESKTGDPKSDALSATIIALMNKKDKKPADDTRPTAQRPYVSRADPEQSGDRSDDDTFEKNDFVGEDDSGLDSPDDMDEFAEDEEKSNSVEYSDTVPTSDSSDYSSDYSSEYSGDDSNGDTGDQSDRNQNNYQEPFNDDPDDIYIFKISDVPGTKAQTVRLTKANANTNGRNYTFTSTYKNPYSNPFMKSEPNTIEINNDDDLTDNESQDLLLTLANPTAPTNPSPSQPARNRAEQQERLKNLKPDTKKFSLLPSFLSFGRDKLHVLPAYVSLAGEPNQALAQDREMAREFSSFTERPTKPQYGDRDSPSDREQPRPTQSYDPMSFRSPLLERPSYKASFVGQQSQERVDNTKTSDFSKTPYEIDPALYNWQPSTTATPSAPSTPTTIESTQKERLHQIESLRQLVALMPFEEAGLIPKQTFIDLANAILSKVMEVYDIDIPKVDVNLVDNIPISGELQGIMASIIGGNSDNDYSGYTPISDIAIKNSTNNLRTFTQAKIPKDFYEVETFEDIVPTPAKPNSVQDAVVRLMATRFRNKQAQLSDSDSEHDLERKSSDELINEFADESADEFTDEFADADLDDENPAGGEMVCTCQYRKKSDVNNAPSSQAVASSVAVRDNRALHNSRAVRDNSSSRAVHYNTGSCAVRDNSGSRVFRDSSGSRAVRDNSGSRAVRYNSGSRAVRDNRGSRAVSNDLVKKKKRDYWTMDQPSDDDIDKNSDEDSDSKEKRTGRVSGTKQKRASRNTGTEIRRRSRSSATKTRLINHDGGSKLKRSSLNTAPNAGLTSHYSGLKSKRKVENHSNTKRSYQVQGTKSKLSDCDNCSYCQKQNARQYRSRK